MTKTKGQSAKKRKCKYCPDPVDRGPCALACSGCLGKLNRDRARRTRAKWKRETGSTRAPWRKIKLITRETTPELRDRQNEYKLLQKLRGKSGIANTRQSWLDVDEAAHLAELDQEGRRVVTLDMFERITSRCGARKRGSLMRAFDRFKRFMRGFGLAKGADDLVVFIDAPLAKKRARYWLARLER